MSVQRTRIVSLLAVPVLLAGAGLTACSSDGGKPSKIALEAAGVVAAQPFVQAPGADIQGVKAVPVTGGTTRADAKGAFGGTPGQTHCDRAKLIDQLTQDPVKGKAWADVRGIAFDRIKDHINGLNEVTLAQDTLVENHNYQGDGKTVAYLSVLQAGVTILQDDYGTPSVKCNCGNPLGKPEDVDRKGSTYTGTKWERFEVTQITVIEARTIEEGPLKSVSLIDVRQPDKAFDRPAKGDGSTDGKPYTLPPQSRPGGTGSPSAEGSGSPSGSASGSASGSPSEPGTGSPRAPLRTPPPARARRRGRPARPPRRARAPAAPAATARRRPAATRRPSRPRSRPRHTPALALAAALAVAVVRTRPRRSRSPLRRPRPAIRRARSRRTPPPPPPCIRRPWRPHPCTPPPWPRP
ncbi:hypothetical protein EKH77_03705 [Streptomyces luteoverticillatus]|uniref:DUF6777 domain-containing protein n=1 Tax=Streptomyces luteoverticillatus TaxID=66425 RepID=A0A3S9PDK6_STRLT|nr:DUF6777 domain-containing protein [Streptomyces luteoverticillatus]AZQ70436.1 hypothetical protein EKH77_03705 [Streptomyces luteoverticillatus]